MPSYSFICTKCNARFDKQLPVSRCTSKPRCACGSRKVERDFSAEHGSTFHKAGNWPLKSEALGVHPEQVAEAMEHAASVGVPTDFTKDGRAVFTSAAHRKAYAEKYGYFDRNGGYSDPQRR